MAKNINSNSNISIQFISGAMLILYLCIGFIPNWGAVDKIAPQWLGLSILNFVSLLIILFNSNLFKSKIYNVIKSGISLFYITFFFWALLSYFYAINQTEVIVNIARQANTLFMYLNMAIFIQMTNDKINWLSWTVVLILSVEVYAILTEVYQMSQSVSGIDPGKLKGVTANRNIGAFSIAIKSICSFYPTDNKK